MNTRAQSTAPATFSADTGSFQAQYTPLGAGASATTGLVNVHASSSLMVNYDSAKAHDFGSGIAVIEDRNGDPMIFAIDQLGHLCAVLRDEGGKTGFKLVDFTQPLTTGGSTIETLNARVLDDSHNFMLVFSAVKNGAATLYTTTKLLADPAAAYWDHPESTWTERPPDSQLKSIDRIDFEEFPGGELVLLVAASQDERSATELDDRYIVDTTVAAQCWKKASLPADGTVKGFALGAMGRKFGCYTLLVNGGQATLNFAQYKSDIKDFDTTVTTDFQNVPPDGDPNIQSMAAVRMNNDKRQVDIFLMGQQLYHLSHKELAEGAFAQVDTIPIGSVMPVKAGDTIQIAACFDGDTNLAIWFLKDGVISLIRGQYASDTYQFTIALPIRDGATGIAALCPSNGSRKNVELFDVVNGTELTYFYSDPVSTIWREIPIHFPNPEHASQYTTYTSCAHFTDADDNPVLLADVEVTASDWGMMTINGFKYSVGPDVTAKVSTDNHGSITFTTMTKTASTPVFTLAMPAERPEDRKYLDLNPYNLIHGNLKQYTTEDAVTNGRTQNGDPIMSGGSRINAGQAAGSFKKLTGIADNQKGLTIRDAGSARNNGLKPSDEIMGTTLAFRGLRGGSPEFLEGDEATAFAAELGGRGQFGSSLGSVFGDAWNAVKHELEKITDGAITAVEGGFQFLLSIGEQSFQFLLTTVEELAHVVQFIFDEIKMAIEKLIEWLGMLFKWQDILKGQKIIAHAIEEGLQFGKREVDSLSEYMAHAAQQYSGASPSPVLPADQANAQPSAARKQTADHLSPDGKNGDNFRKSPGGRFAHYHLTHTAQKGFESLPAPGNTPFGAQSGATDFKTVIKDFDNNFKDILEGFAQPLSVLFERFQGTGSAQEIGNDLFGILKIVGARGAQVFADAMKVAGEMCDQADGWLKKEPDIPFISGFFRLITRGEEANVLNAFSLIVAVPSITLVKVVSGSSPFKDGTRGLDTTENLFNYLGYAPAQALSFAEDSGDQKEAVKLYHVIGGAVAIAAYELVTIIRLSGSEPNEAEKAIMLAGNICILFATFPATAKAPEGQPVSYMLWGGGYIMILIGVLAMINESLKDAGTSIKVVWSVFAGVLSVILFILNKSGAKSVGWLAEKMVSSLLGHVGTLGELIKKFQEAPPPLQAAGKACAYIGFGGKSIGDLAQYVAFVNGET